MPFITAEDVAKDNTESFLAKLRASGLDEDDAKLLRMEPLTKAEIEARGLGLSERGFQIPYFNWSGEPTGFWRFRFLTEVKDAEKKTVRYIQPPGTLNEVYAPPLIDWQRILENPHEPVIITEGELKAACACKAGFHVLGLGGVNCYTSTRFNKWLLDQLIEIVKPGRKVYIAFDSDSASNANVLGAEADLAHRLVSYGANVFISRIPSTIRGQKQGLDDFIVGCGADAFASVLANSQEYSASAALHEFNRRFIYVMDPGFVLELPCEDAPEGKRASTDKWKESWGTCHHIEQVYSQSGTKQKQVSTPDAWLVWPQRRTVRKMGYFPGKEQYEQNQYNVWTGWVWKPVKGDIGPFKMLLDFLFQGLDAEARKWVEQWLAYPIQHPGTKLYSAVVLYSSQHGVGKGLLGYILRRLYGDVNCVEVTSEGLQDTRNSWMENKQFVIGDEIVVGDKRTTADRIKNMITSHTIKVDEKYMPSYEARNICNFYLTSQHVDAVKIEDTDRRFFAHEAGNGAAPLTAAQYAEIDRWYRSTEGMQALMHWLMHEVDCEGFNPRVGPPETEAKREMRELGRTAVGEWVAMLKQHPDSVLRMGEMILHGALYSSNDLINLFDPDNRHRVTPNGLSRELRKQGFYRVNSGGLVDVGGGKRDRLWCCRKIDERDPRSIGAEEAAKLYAEGKRPRKEKF